MSVMLCASESFLTDVQCPFAFVSLFAFFAPLSRKESWPKGPDHFAKPEQQRMRASLFYNHSSTDSATQLAVENDTLSHMLFD